MKKLILLAILLIVWNLAHAQDYITISGKIISKKENIPLPYAYIQLKGVALGTVSKPNGEFTIHIPKRYQNNYLQFSYLGYETKEIAIAKAINLNPLTVILQESNTLLKEVTIESKKGLTAKQLLRKVLQKIPENYVQDSFLMTGYYRETLKENGVYIKYADASCQYFLTPYKGKKIAAKHLDKFNPKSGGISTMNPMSMYWGDRLHRGHFNGQTVKEDQVKMIEARASKNLSKHHMIANIEGGPLSLIGKDRIKYLRYFLDKKNLKKYTFVLSETLAEDGNWQYIITFKPQINTEVLEQIQQLKAANKTHKQWRMFNKHIDKPLAGKLYISPKNFAVTAIEYRIPQELKAHFCGFTTMAIKHFDYSIQLEYQQINGKWFPKHIRQEDEFIVVDTVTNTTTPYAAISELSVLEIKNEAKNTFPKAETFPNYDNNVLYDYPTSYNPDFWQSYHQKYPQTNIGSNISQEMSKSIPLEVQFKLKHLRDSTMQAPIAKKSHTSNTYHNITIEDDYAWLKDTSKHVKSNQAVMHYLNAENDYAENYFAPLRDNQRKIFQEMARLIPKNEKSLPQYSRGYWYYYKYSAGQDYRVFYRKKDQQQAKEEILLDENKLAQQYAYFSIDRYSISPNNQLMAYWENTLGNDTPTLVFKDLKTGKLLTDTLKRTGQIAWLADNSGFYYSWLEPKTNRSIKIFSHKLGQKQSEDQLIYEEKDPLFNIGIETTKDFQYVIISSGSYTTTELRYKRNDTFKGSFQLVQAKEEGHRYYASYYKGRFYIATNQEAKNFKIMEVSANNPSIENWKEIIPHNNKAVITNFKRFDDYLAIGERKNATDRIRIIDLYTNKAHYIKIKGSLSNVRFGYNPKSDTKLIRIVNGALNLPDEVYDYNMETKEKTLIRKDTLSQNPFESVMNHAKVKRTWAYAKDGTKIPITLIYKDFLTNRKENKHLWLTAYGSYGMGNIPNFSRAILPLINRGIVFAIAHVRGGNDMGEDWHDQGKMLKKKNTFADFIACAEHLIDEGYTEKGKIIAQGASAGGLLMGVIANERPELFQTIILDVPFVDALNTLLDPKLPGTVEEYVEFANPNRKKDFEYLLSYSPYNNVKQQAYPNLLFFTGLNDSRVGYWEPAKMIAKLRESNTSDNLILLKTDFNAGHGGSSGRFARYKDIAYKYALIFELIDKHSAMQSSN